MNNYQQGNLGGSLTPTRVAEFGIRVSPVEGGFLINKFDQGLAVCTTVEEARKVVMAYFDEILTPKEEIAKEEVNEEKGKGTEDLPLSVEEMEKSKVEATELPEGPIV